MVKNYFILLLLIIILSPVFMFSCSPVRQIKAEYGKMDLSTWDFNADGTVQLDGEWEFYWNKFLYHEDFTSPDQVYVCVYKPAATLWTDYLIDGKHLPAFGYATFRLLVALPDKDTMYAFRLMNMSTAYNLYVDGKLIMGNGQAGTNKNESIPEWKTRTAVYLPQSDTIEIIVHVSNFHYDKPGFWRSIAFGPHDQISLLNLREKSWDYFIVGIFLAIGIYHLILFFLGRNDKSTLYYGIFCLVFTIRSTFTDERIVFDLFPWINWYTSLLLEFLSIYVLVIFFILFLQSLYPKELSTVVNRIIIITTIVIGVVLTFLPTTIMNILHSYYLLIMIFIIIYISIALVIASVRNRVGALFLLIGFILFSITIVHDILAAEYIIINTGFISPIGILFFILTEFALYIKFIKAEDELREREKELLQAEKLASLGTLITGIAHEINNPNSSIYLTTGTLTNIWDNLEPQLEEIVKSEGDFYVGNLPYSEVKDEIPGSLKRIMRNSDRIKTIVKDLKDYAKKDESNCDQPVYINEIIESALCLLQNYIKKSTTNLTLNLSDSLPPVKGNSQRIEQVILNIIQNACQALEDKDKGITISTTCDDAKKMVFITVQDQGIGMDKKTLKQIYDPFFTTKRTNGGTGLGLAVTSRIIRDHSGTIEYKSKPGKGTTVIIGLNILY